MPSSAGAGYSPPSTAQMALALAQIVHNREYNPSSHSRPEYNSPQLKHLQLLDLLALLLVTDSQGDVAATTLVARSKGTYDFYYAKNRPCFDSEKDYVNALLATLSNDSIDFKEKTIKLMALVVKNCSKKIIHRIKKIVRRVKEIHRDFFDSPEVPDIPNVLCSEQASKELGVEQSLREVMPSVFWEDQGLGDFLSEWIQYLHSTSAQEMLGGDPRMVLSRFGTSYLISETKGMSQVIDQTLLNRIKKLGDYYRAVVILTTAYRDARIRFTDETRPFLNCTEVVPPNPIQSNLTNNPLGTLNAFASYKGLDFVNAEELKSAFNRADLPDKPGVMAVTESVHCECSIILEILKQFPTSPIVVVEVGISKSMCWLCNEFFRAFQKKHPHIMVYYSTCHGKYTTGWRFPETTPIALRHSMEHFVEEELLEVHSKALRKRKSDSEPREDNFHSTSIQDFAVKGQEDLPRDIYKRRT